jgi:hypothetical protein
MCRQDENENWEFTCLSECVRMILQCIRCERGDVLCVCCVFSVRRDGAAAPMIPESDTEISIAESILSLPPPTMRMQ